ncbi:MAG TPA: electron transfer flavoprotein-ubiquinone oxidoreductase [Rhodocyclaceae bacterium]|nr:electron transfer flavoprotein-ubiquinone oxidoreductase [Rhodocyclaceae bacterium]
MSDDIMQYDVLIVGAGPSGLGAAIRLKQLALAAGRELSVCILEKGAEVGSHILSGAVIDPKALTELFPDWKEKGAPLNTPVTSDEMWLLSQGGGFRLPQFLLPPLMHNHGMYVASLGELCRWLGSEAEALGVEIYAGFSAAEAVYDDQGRMLGIRTGEMGLDRDGKPTDRHVPGMEIHAAYTLVAEGARGSLGKQLDQKFNLRGDSGPSKYALGVKEVWRIAKDKHRPGHVQHSLGWPLDSSTGGGSFLYHYGENLVSIGFVTHLDYSDPRLSPFDEMQRFKTHPTVAPLLEGGERIGYGARAINAGGLQALPKLVFPGGALLGCSAGFLNVPRIKGSHTAMKSGMLAAEAAFAAIDAGRANDELVEYPAAVAGSWIWQELELVRNVKPYLSRWGEYGAMLIGGFEMWLGSFGVKLPWTLKHRKADHDSLKSAASTPKPVPVKFDGKLTFDRLSSLALANLQHEHSQPVHLKLIDPALAINYNLANFDAPEQYYCPAGVYEIVNKDTQPALQINAQNCVHCKTCDIKDPLQNIVWTLPEGGSGPQYTGM